MPLPRGGGSTNVKEETVEPTLRRQKEKQAKQETIVKIQVKKDSE